MLITGTHIAYLHTCRRKLWLFANGINMEHTSDLVAEGKLIDETSYRDRAKKYTQLELSGIKIDYYDQRNKVIHEVKKSDKVEDAHISQVKYYIYRLQKEGIEGVTGLIEYPRLKQRQHVELDVDDVQEILRWENEVREIVQPETCPERVKLKICKRCSYHDFCYTEEYD